MIEIYLQWKTNRKSYVAYLMAPVLVTLKDIEGHSLVAGLFKCNPSNICAAGLLVFMLLYGSGRLTSLVYAW